MTILQARPDDATLIQDAQTLLEAFAGRDAAVLLSSVTELCRLLASRGSSRRAERLLLQMLPIGDQHLDRDHVALGHVLHELAYLYVREARYTDAEPLLLRLYYMQCRRCGKDHPDAAAVLASLARVRQALGQHDDAEAMWRQVIAVCERSLGSQHVATTTAVERLAESCAARGKLREAVQLRAHATTMRDAAATRALPAATDPVEATHAAEPVAPVDTAAEAPARHALVVLPSSGGALTVEEQPAIAALPPGTTQDTLLAIHAELQATSGRALDAGRRRRWPAATAAAAVVALLGGLTASGAASTFGARPGEAPVRWAAWNAPAPLAPRSDSASAPAADTASYGVRLAADAPGRLEPAPTPVLIRARLVGPVPRLSLPDSLSTLPVGDGVVVRVAVDSRGIPDAASMVVVSAPHPALVDVVRHAIPDLRFVPARHVAPGSATEADVVEMSFGFSRVVR